MIRPRTYKEYFTPNYVTATYNGSGNIKLLGDAYNINNVRHLIIDGNKELASKTFNFASGGDHIVEIHLKPMQTNAASMFNTCPNLKNFDLSKFDMSNVTNISSMFYKDEGLLNVVIENVNWSKVATMNSFMSECAKLNSIRFTNVKSGKITNMEWAFNWTSLTNCDLSGLDLSSVTTMASMFKNCWDLTSLTIMSPITALNNVNEMFYLVWTRGDFYYNKNYDYSKLNIPRRWNKIAK